MPTVLKLSWWYKTEFTKLLNFQIFRFDIEPNFDLKIRSKCLMAAFCLLPHYWAYYFETSHDDTRQSQQNCSIFDFSLPGHVTQNEVKRSTFLFLFQNRSAFDIEPMDLKLYRMILDRSLFDSRSCDPAVKSKLKMNCYSAFIIKSIDF